MDIDKKSVEPALCHLGEARKTDLVRNPLLAAANLAILYPRGRLQLQRIKELEIADSIHVECIAESGYMQEKVLMTPNDVRSPRVCYH